jgi:serine beta-lactamase-like protein LACTB
MRYQDYMRQRVFAPAGMTSTRVDDVFDIVPHRARGYRPRVFGEFDGNYRNASLMDSSYKIPGGGFLSTAEDLARFAIAVNRGVLVRKETLIQMSTPAKLRDGSPIGYALGWYVEAGDPAAPGFQIWHGGVQAGFSSELRLIPSREFAIVILTNLEGGGRLGLGTLAAEIAASLLKSGS